MTDKIIERVWALLEKTTANGCTEAEAIAAANKAGQLIEKYNLDLSELNKVEDTKVVQQDWFGKSNAALKEVGSIASQVASFTETRVWRGNLIRPETGRRGHAYCFIGLEVDVAFASWLMDLFANTLQNEWKSYRKGPAFPFVGSNAQIKKSFSLGYSARICSRLREMAREREQERTDAQSDQMGALVVQKQALIDAEMNNQGVVLNKARRRRKRKVRQDGYSAGYAAGGHVNITTGIGS